MEKFNLLRAIPFEKIDGLLQHVPGLNVVRSKGIYSPYAHVSSRGFSGNSGQSMLLVQNNVPFTIAATNNINWNRLAIVNIKKLTIHKGNFSAIGGSNATAGILMLEEKESEKRIETVSRVSYSIFNTIAPEISIFGTLNEKFKYNVSGFYTSSSGYSPYEVKVDSLDEESTALNELSITGTFGYALKEWLQLKLHGGLYRSKRNDGLSFNGRSIHNRINTPEYNATIFGELKKWNYYFTAYYIWEDFESTFINHDTSGTNRVWADWIDTGLKWGTSYKYNNNCVLKADMYAEERSTLGEDSLHSIMDITRHRGKYRYVSGDLSAELFKNRNFNFNVDVRWDNFSFYDADVVSDTTVDSLTTIITANHGLFMWNAISSRLSMVYYFSNDLKLELIGARGFRAGTLQDYSYQGFKGDYFLLANPKLKPEILHSVDLRMSYKMNKKISGYLTGYYNYGTNYIFYETLDTLFYGYKALRPENAGIVTILGFETNWDIQTGKSFKLIPSYMLNYSKVNIGSINGAVLPFSPNHIGKLGLIWSYKGWMAGAFGIVKSKQFDNLENMEEIDAYATADAKVSYKTKNDRFSYYISLFDILNNSSVDNTKEEYPGLRFSIGLKFVL